MIEPTAGQASPLSHAFRRIGQTLVSGLDVKEVLGSIVDEAMAQLDAEVAILRLLDRPGEHLELELTRGVPAEIVRQVR